MSSASIKQTLQSGIPMDLGYSDFCSQLFGTEATELAILEGDVTSVSNGLFVRDADTDGLGRWELLLDLPVKPVGTSIADRRARVSAKLRQRFSFYGKDLRAGIEQISGGPIVDTTVNASTGTVTIYLGVQASAYAVAQTLRYCQEAGPAHIQWIIISPNAVSSFIVGISKAGASL